MASFAFVTELSERTQRVSILSYIAFFVGTSRLPFHHAQYTSSGTEISQVNVPPDFHILSVSSADMSVSSHANFVLILDRTELHDSQLFMVTAVDIVYRLGSRRRPVSSCSISFIIPVE